MFFASQNSLYAYNLNYCIARGSGIKTPYVGKNVILELLIEFIESLYICLFPCILSMIKRSFKGIDLVLTIERTILYYNHNLIAPCDGTSSQLLRVFRSISISGYRRALNTKTKDCYKRCVVYLSSKK